MVLASVVLRKVGVTLQFTTAEIEKVITTLLEKNLFDDDADQIIKLITVTDWDAMGLPPSLFYKFVEEAQLLLPSTKRKSRTKNPITNSVSLSFGRFSKSLDNFNLPATGGKEPSNILNVSVIGKNGLGSQFVTAATVFLSATTPITHYDHTYALKFFVPRAKIDSKSSIVLILYSNKDPNTLDQILAEKDKVKFFIYTFFFNIFLAVTQ